MLEQFLFAYIGGVVLVICFEVAKIFKARRMNQAAIEAGLIARDQAKARTAEINREAMTPSAANESFVAEPARLAG